MSRRRRTSFASTVQRIGGTYLEDLCSRLRGSLRTLARPPCVEEVGDNAAYLRKFITAEAPCRSGRRTQAQARPLRGLGRAEGNRVLVTRDIRQSKDVFGLLAGKPFRRYVDENQVRVGVTADDA